MEHQQYHLLLLLCTFLIHSAVSTVLEQNNYHKVASGTPPSSFLEMFPIRSILDCANECLRKAVCNVWAFDNENNNCFLKVYLITSL